MSARDWRPTADLETLKARSELMQVLRAFFLERGYLEVETPQLTDCATPDPNVESLLMADGGGFLHTSPEFAMKRLLAAYQEPIYQVCKVFRDDEYGRLHNREFSMLEWYRPGFNHHDLMEEIEKLLQTLGVIGQHDSCEKISYREAFACMGFNPHECDLDLIREAIASQGITLHSPINNIDEGLDLLMGEVIGPGLGQAAPCFIYDYPASQAALARLSDSDSRVAERFELYWRGIELANGFHELTDATAQRARFNKELELRTAKGQHAPEIDEKFLSALEEGMPDAAGVALGIDRLLMLMLGKTTIAEVMSFG